MYVSKYYDLEKGGGKGWTETDFRWAVEQLERMSREELVALCEAPPIHLTFTDYDPPELWEQKTPAEEIISALLADYPPATLLPLLRKAQKPDRSLPSQRL